MRNLTKFNANTKKLHEPTSGKSSIVLEWITLEKKSNNFPKFQILYPWNEVNARFDNRTSSFQQ